MGYRWKNTTERSLQQEKPSRYSFSAVYYRSWKIIILALLVMLLVFPLLGFTLAGKNGFYGALLGLFIGINFQLLTFLFQYLSLQAIQRSRVFFILGFIIKMLFIVGSLTLICELLPKVVRPAMLTLLASVFICALLEARLLGSPRMIVINPKPSR